MVCECCASAATARFFDADKARKELRGYHRRGPGPTTRRLLSGLRSAGASGTLLDAGSGSGILTLELLKSGVTRAICIDISAGSLGVAQEEAHRQGLADRITWQEGDLTELAATLPEADIVTLDRVVCCYPAYRPLLMAAAGRSREWLAYSYPRNRWLVRAVLWLENLWFRVRGLEFQAYAHPIPAMDAVLREAGFAPVRHDATLAWQSSVYRRKPEAGSRKPT
jgi:magnesium-protoporphyrin O-methyltransferase